MSQTQLIHQPQANNKLVSIGNNNVAYLLSSSQLDKKKELEQQVIQGIESGKRGFMAAANALIEIEQLGLWKNESNSFDNYRAKFKELLSDTEYSERHVLRLIAASKVNLSLRPIGQQLQKESHARPLAVLSESVQIQRAYIRAVEIAEEKGGEIKAEYIQQAVEEIKPSGVRARKQPRITIGATVEITSSYTDVTMHGKQGRLISYTNSSECLVEIDGNARLFPNWVIREVIRDISGATSVKEVINSIATNLGIKTSDSSMPEAPRNEGERTQHVADSMQHLVNCVRRDSKMMTQQEKIILLEHLMKEVNYDMLPLSTLKYLEAKVQQSLVH